MVETIQSSDRERVLVIYDGSCRICRREAVRLKRLVGQDRVRLADYHAPGVVASAPGVTRDDCERALQAIWPDGTVREGASAILTLLGERPLFVPLKLALNIPPFRHLAESVYSWIAANRYRLGNQACEDGSCQLHDS